MPVQQHSVWQSLKTRFDTLPAWHQFICKTAIEKGILEQHDIDLAYQYFCIANRLVDTQEVIPECSLDDAVPANNDVACEQIKLDKLAALTNINAISETASLSFHPGLTVIYGKNGTGKSGFARVLKASCFSRAGKYAIEPDIRNPDSSTVPQQASIYLSGHATPIMFMPGQQNADLQRIAFFDAEAASNHVSGYNPVEFVPAGIDVLDEEVRVFGVLKAALQSKITERTQANMFAAQFDGGESTVKTAIATLGATTDISALKALAIFGAAEIKELERLAAELKTLQDSATLLQAEKTASPHLKSLITQLDAFTAGFSEEKRQEYAALVENMRVCAEKVRALQATLSVDMGALEGEWRDFLSTAHALGTQINPHYPSPNDACLLCGRPLDGHEALGHIEQFWNFLKDKASKELAGATKKIESAIAALNAATFDICAPSTVIRGYIFTKNQSLVGTVDAFIAALGQQRDAVIQFLKGEAADLPNMLAAVPSPIADLRSLQDTVASQIKTIEENGTTALVAACRSKIALLQHQEKLSKIMAAVESYVADQQWIKKAIASLTQLNSGSINTKKTKLVKEFLDGNYEGLFNDELKKLGFSHLKIACDSRSRGAESTEKFFRIRLHGRELSPEKILSEGEQKALALADFLASLYINPEFCGAIFDDPVTSLDHEIRECVAKRLVEEAQFRQIVVFTHDLVFLNQLISSARENSLDFRSHWIERQGDVIGVVNDGECPITSEKFSNTNFAKACLQDAFANHTGEERNRRVKTAMGYLRRTLEQAVIEALFKGTVQRWEDRIRMYQLKKIEWLPQDFAGKVIGTYEGISKYVEGHAVSEASQDAPPSETTLQSLCVSVDALKGEMKKLGIQDIVAS